MLDITTPQKPTIKSTKTPTDQDSLSPIRSPVRLLPDRLFKRWASLCPAGLEITPLDEAKFETLDVCKTHAIELPDYARGRKLNRYSDILPNPLTRVRLPEINGDPTSEYLNANYIGGLLSAREYIASQGPLPNTIHNFMRLIWEKSIDVIVMLTGIIEQGKVKCEHYWPKLINKDGEIKYGEYNLTLVRVEECNGYAIHYMNLSLGQISRQLVHFWYNTWPGNPTTYSYHISRIFYPDLFTKARIIYHISLLVHF